MFFTWGIVELVGWLSTHYWQTPGINWVWVGLSVVGLIPMFMYMSFKAPKMRNILLLWIGVLVVGMVASFGAFGWPGFGWLSPINLGAFWLVLMGIAFLINAIWWTPSTFLAGGVLQITAGTISWTVPAVGAYQFIVAAVVGSGAMFLLMAKKGAK